MAAFPAAKLGALVLKQVSKPIANACKNYAKSSPFFRKYICMPPAQFYHWSEVKMKMWILNLGKPVNIPVLNEQQAIELGANLLGEGVIFTIAALILISEYQRSAAKEAKKEAAIKAEKRHLESSIQELYFVTQKQSAQINELMRLVYDLEGRVVQVPWKSKKTPTEDDPPQSPPPPPPSFFSQEDVFDEDQSPAIPPIIPVPNGPEGSLPIPPSIGQPPSFFPDGAPPSNHPNQPGKKVTRNCITSSSLIGCAYDLVENELFSDGRRTPSIVNLGLDHLYNNVYRSPLRT